MSLPYSKKDLFKSALKGRFIKEFDYNTFENITVIARGGCGTVYCANSTNLEKLVALKSLHENNDEFCENFVRELTNIMAVNNHDNIINFYGISIDPSTETYYIVLQYARNGDLSAYLKKNFKSLDWKTKIKMAKDITRGLRYIHKENIVHKDLHSKNILVHEGRLLIADLGLSRSLDSNSNSKSMGALEIYKLVIYGKREAHINKAPKDYINIYSSAWNDDPNQRPTIENIFEKLENIKLENINDDFNDIQFKVNINNQSQASINSFSRDSISNASSCTTSDCREVTVMNNFQESSAPPSTPQSDPHNYNDYGSMAKGNQIIKYNYDDFENLKNIGKGIYSAILMDENRTVALKSMVVTSTELFVNELKRYSRASSHENIIRFYGISQKVNHGTPMIPTTTKCYF
ncbi:2079_t:CDS:2 [Diversispora eburnea]|uniref:2079_t:CDS:1 n=1 Tax=Diversispora eburnea TaxID=1213867 RepID=A0A9N9BP74_9GLOM|nr:2079_t:CDS:2 [Diversispora eburnea]